MRKYISMLLLIVLAMVITSGAGAESSISVDQSDVTLHNRQTATATVTQEMGVMQLEPEKTGLGDFLSVNWGVLSLSLLSFLEVVTRLTPTEKDNTVLKFLSNILNAIIPNLKKGGGRL